MIRTAKKWEKSTVIQMWDEVFGEGAQYMELYFSHKYLTENCYVCMEGEEMVSSLQVLPYELAYYHQNYGCGYLSGVATQPQHRGKGYMQQLMHGTLRDMKQRGFAVGVLIPASQSLFDLYGRYDFATCFAKGEMLIEKESTEETLLIKEENQLEELFWFYDKWQTEKSVGILKNKNDFWVVKKEHEAGGGKVLALYEDNQMAAIGFAMMGEERLMIKELVVFSEKMGRRAIDAILGWFHQVQGVLVVAGSLKDDIPVGMVRILDAKKMLDAFAFHHKKDEKNICLRDEVIASNNGYYKIKNGQCTYEQQGDEIWQTMTTKTLAQMIFVDEMKEKPYMNLMLN